MNSPSLPLLWLFGATLALTTACSSDDDMGSGGGGPSVSQNEVVVYTNTTDPRIATVTTPSNEVITYFGERDAVGMPMALTAIDVTTNGDMDSFQLDSDARPVRALATNGTSFEFEWQPNGTSVVVSALSPSGEVQVSTLVDFTEPRLTEGPRPIEPLVTNTSMRAGIRSTSFTGPPDVGAGIASQSLPLGSGSGAVITTVLDCGLARNGLGVRTLVFDESNSEFIGSFPTTSVGDGMYASMVPIGQTTTGIDQTVCETIESTLGLSCTALEGIGGPAGATRFCVSISAALDAIAFGPTGEFVAILAACESVVASLSLYCETLGAGAPGGPSIAGQLCDQLFEDETTPATIRVSGCVSALPQDVCSSESVVSTLGSFPVQLSIDLGSNVQIRTLTLDPSNPAEGQSYTAILDVSCLPTGSSVVMSILGTDGYSDSRTFDVSAGQLEGLFNLNVPGAQSGVMDTVTGRVSVNGDEVAMRVASLVFGG